MDVYAGFQAVPAWPGCVVALGTFDGVHRGHVEVFGRTRRAAAALGLPAVAFTFDPHPTAVVAPRSAPPLISGIARRLHGIRQAGMDATVVQPFTAALAAQSAEAFVADVLAGALRARHVVVGWDFTYGRGRGGTTATLQAQGAGLGLGVDVVPQVTLDDRGVSSTAIRRALQAGEQAEAEAMLGRRYDVDGVVVHGAKRGRELGFPTANIACDVPPLLPTGIYAVTLQQGGASPMPAVASLGTNPTFVAGGAVSLEVFVLDWSGDLYDQRVRVAFAGRIRGEAKFASIEALVVQMHADVAAARGLLGA